MKLVNREWGLDAGGTPVRLNVYLASAAEALPFRAPVCSRVVFENGEIFYRTPGGWVSK